MLQPTEIERALVVTAHPDDVDFGAAGTVATLTSAGTAVSYCLVTSGDAGHHDPTMSREDLIALREREQTAAAREVGVTDLHWLHHPDGRVQPTLELRRDISRVIRQVRPQVVITQSPERNWARVYASHPDHLAAGEATMCAVYPDARNHFAHPELLAEGLDAWTVSEVWLMAMTASTDHVDVTQAYPAKRRALLSHVSQRPAGGTEEGVDALLKGWMGTTAQSCGLPSGRLAEAFQVVDTR